MNDTIMNLLHKIKALADRGVDGERQVAMKKLAALMKKYRITDADLEDVRTYPVIMKYRTSFEKILGIILAYRVSSGEIPVRIMPRKKIALYMTRAQAAEWCAQWDHYLPVLRRDHRMFLSAFLHRQEIHPPKTCKSRQLSADQIRAILAQLRYMDRVPFMKMHSLIGGHADASVATAKQVAVPRSSTQEST